MKTLLRIFRKSAMLITLLLSLILTVPKSWSQSIAKTDSICLCGPKKQIDSTLKILNDYPDMKRQLMLVSKLLDSERRLTDIEQAAILKVLGLECDWDIKKVKQRIRRLKFKKWIWGAGGVGVGVLIGLMI